jgi:hypothetical protein
MNRTRKRISEYPFQPVRRKKAAFSPIDPPPEGDFTDSAGPCSGFL